MSDTKTPNTPDPAKDNGADKKAKEMTKAEAAKRVKRFIYGPVKSGKLDAEGKDVMEIALIEKVAVRADEVLDFKDFGTHVVVVTVDGQKFRSDVE